MKTYTNAEGWVFDYHHRDADLFSIPTETISKTADFWVYLCHIPSSKGMTRRVYFVDKYDRNAWVTLRQFKSKHEALNYLQEVKNENQ